jgi:putative transposase
MTASGSLSPLLAAVMLIPLDEAMNRLWRRKQYGGMKVNQARRLKELEQENGRLKRLVADQALDLSIHKEVSRGNF